VVPAPPLYIQEKVHPKVLIDELIDGIAESEDGYSKTAGVQQAHKEDKITFTSLTPWPGGLVYAKGRYIEGNTESSSEKRAAICVGPEFGTVSRPDLVSVTHRVSASGWKCTP